MTAGETLELLSDLKHDLGKYLVLPFALLPKGADGERVREALGRALRETRKGPRGVTSARSLWQRFEAELPDELATRAGLRALHDAVERALSWEQALEGAVEIERDAVERDLRAVQTAIAALIDEVRVG
jgi:hypothetical protein